MQRNSGTSSAAHTQGLEGCSGVSADRKSRPGLQPGIAAILVQKPSSIIHQLHTMECLLVQHQVGRPDLNHPLAIPFLHLENFFHLHPLAIQLTPKVGGLASCLLPARQEFLHSWHLRASMKVWTWWLYLIWMYDTQTGDPKPTTKISSLFILTLASAMVAFGDIWGSALLSSFWPRGSSRAVLPGSSVPARVGRGG